MCCGVSECVRRCLDVWCYVYSAWFKGADWDQLKLGNIEDHIAYSFFYKVRLTHTHTHAHTCIAGGSYGPIRACWHR